MQAGRDQESLDAYYQAGGCDPILRVAHNNLGNLLWAPRGESAAAEKAFRDALRIDPAHAEAAFNLGIIFQSRKDFPLALDFIAKRLN